MLNKYHRKIVVVDINTESYLENDHFVPASTDER